MLKIKKIIQVVLLFFIAISIVGCNTTGNVTITKIEGKSSTLPEEVVINQYDIRDAVIIVYYSNGDTEEVNVTYSMFETSDINKFAQLGSHTVSIKYKSLIYEYNFTVIEPSEELLLSQIDETAEKMDIPKNTTTNFVLPTSSGYVFATWSVLPNDYLVLDGTRAIVTRPLGNQEDAVVTLKGLFKLYGTSKEITFDITIPKYEKEEFNDIIEEIKASFNTTSTVSDSLTLPFDINLYDNPCTVNWTSDSDAIVIDNLQKKVTVNQKQTQTEVNLSCVVSYAGYDYEINNVAKVTVLPKAVVLNAPAPKNVKISNSSLVWDAVSGITTYRVYVDGVSVGTTTNTNYSLLTIITNSGSYTVAVQSIATGQYNVDSTLVSTTYVCEDKVSYNGNYYNGINLKATGSTLKSSLRELLTTTQKKRTTYDDLKDYIPITDASPNNASKVLLFYSRIETQGEWSDNGYYWNREHVWPQSLGWFSTSNAGADLHHLRPEDQKVNSTRGNDKFGEVSNGSIVYTSPQNGAKSSNCYSNGTYFEPQDCAKGDVARIILYLLIRYSEADKYSITTVSQNKNLLLEWNKLDPVDEWEMARNNATEIYQGNRNPFIDYSYLADQITWN